MCEHILPYFISHLVYKVIRTIIKPHRVADNRTKWQCEDIKLGFELPMVQPDLNLAESFRVDLCVISSASCVVIVPLFDIKGKQ